MIIMPLPNRYFSKKQEKEVAKQLGGKTVSNSGATRFDKGDAQTKDFLLECKTATKQQKSFTIKKEWLLKKKEEAFAMGKDYNALVFDFGDSKRYYIIDEKTFKIVQELLENDCI